MARLALHPQVSGVLDVDAEYRMEEIRVTEGCEGAAKTIGDIRGGSYIVGLRLAAGSFKPQPQSETVLAVGDVIMAMGIPRTGDQVERLRHLLNHPPELAVGHCGQRSPRRRRGRRVGCRG